MIAKIEHNKKKAYEHLIRMFSSPTEFLAAGGLVFPYSEIEKIEDLSADIHPVNKKELRKIAKSISRDFEGKIYSYYMDSLVTIPLVEYIISFAIGEHISSEVKEEIMRDYMTQMGIPVDYISFFSVIHNTTNCEHIHILCHRLNLITYRVYPINHDYIRTKKVCAELNKKYNLITKVENPKRDRSKTNTTYLSKIDTTENIKKIIIEAKSLEDFKALLASAGIKMEEKPRGCVFAVKDKDGYTHHWSGSQLSKELTLPNLIKQFGNNEHYQAH